MPLIISIAREEPLCIKASADAAAAWQRGEKGYGFRESGTIEYGDGRSLEIILDVAVRPNGKFTEFAEFPLNLEAFGDLTDDAAPAGVFAAKQGKITIAIMVPSLEDELEANVDKAIELDRVVLAKGTDAHLRMIVSAKISVAAKATTGGRPDEGVLLVQADIGVVVQGASHASGAANGGVRRVSQPFVEQTTTAIVFAHGAVVRLAEIVTPGQILILRHGDSHEEAACRVVNVKTASNADSYVEVEFLQPAPGFWGAALESSNGRKSPSAPAARPRPVAEIPTLPASQTKVPPGRPVSAAPPSPRPQEIAKSAPAAVARHVFSKLMEVPAAIGEALGRERPKTAEPETPTASAAPVRVQTAPVIEEPTPAVIDDAAVSAPAEVAAEPDSGTATPALDVVETSHAISEPAVVAAEPTRVLIEPEQVAVAAAPLIAEPEPVADEVAPAVPAPEPEVIEAEQIIAVPAPVADEVAAVTGVPEPDLLEAAPVAAEPAQPIAEPAAVTEERAPEILENAPVANALAEIVAEPTQVAAATAPVAAEPAEIVAEAAPAAAALAPEIIEATAPVAAEPAPVLAEAGVGTVSTPVSGPATQIAESAQPIAVEELRLAVAGPRATRPAKPSPVPIVKSPIAPARPAAVQASPGAVLGGDKAFAWSKEGAPRKSRVGGIAAAAGVIIAIAAGASFYHWQQVPRPDASVAAATQPAADSDQTTASDPNASSGASVKNSVEPVAAAASATGSSAGYGAQAGGAAAKTKLPGGAQPGANAAETGSAARSVAPPEDTPEFVEGPEVAEMKMSTPTAAAHSTNQAAPSIAADVPSADEGGSEGGILSASDSGGPEAPPTRTSTGAQQPRLLSAPTAVYPYGARAEHVQGDVAVDILINEAGNVTTMTVLSGPTLLRDATLEALRRRKYAPAMLDGKPIPAHVVVITHFQL